MCKGSRPRLSLRILHVILLYVAGVLLLTGERLEGFESHFVWQVRARAVFCAYWNVLLRSRQSHQSHPFPKAPSHLFDP